MAFPVVTTSFTKIPNGIEVFSRQSGPSDGKVFLILHGFPTSSYQYRNMIPLIAASGYRVIAPDLPGFGFTRIPDSLSYEHSFANFAKTITSFLDALSIKHFAVYVNDYGAPTAYRIALDRPSAILGIVSQNGNAYNEGFGDFWQPLKNLWQSKSGSDEEAGLKKQISDAIFTFDTTKFQYAGGEPDPESIDPASYHLDWALMQQPGNLDVQMTLFQDYKTNADLYPQFQEYFRKSNVPILAIWGKNDIIFIPPGAEAFKRDSKAIVELWDGGHFLAESHSDKLGRRILEWLKEVGI